MTEKMINTTTNENYDNIPIKSINSKLYNFGRFEITEYHLFTFIPNENVVHGGEEPESRENRWNGNSETYSGMIRNNSSFWETRPIPRAFFCGATTLEIAGIK